MYEYSIEDDKLMMRKKETIEMIQLGGYIEIIVTTRNTTKKDGFGFLLRWKNIEGVVLNKVFFVKDVLNERSSKVREQLIDSGYYMNMNPKIKSWDHIKVYLIEKMKEAKFGLCVTKIGWHENVFVTHDWQEGCSTEKYYYAGSNVRNNIRASGSLKDWQVNIGALCVGNPMMIFAVGAALAAPILKLSLTESGLFHYVGDSSIGKTTLLKLAASVYGDRRRILTWVATANGLEALATANNDTLLILDELGAANPLDVADAVYRMVGGSSKSRCGIEGELSEHKSWRTLGISAGEMYLSELLAEVGKEPKAGELVRLIEIPVFGKFGCFDNLHGFSKPSQFAEHVSSMTDTNYGTLFREWIKLIAESEEVKEAINLEQKIISNAWIEEHMDSQVVRAIRRFAVVTAALVVASRYGLLPWSEELSKEAGYIAFNKWLESRGHALNQELGKTLKQMKGMLHQLKSDISTSTSDENIAPEYKNTKRSGFYFREIGGEVQWVIDSKLFKELMKLPEKYMRYISPMIRKGLMESGERGCLKLTIGGKRSRYFVIWPERVEKYIEEVGLDG